MFSKESSRAFFEMGNVVLIELKKSSIQSPSCFHYVFEGTISSVTCGMLLQIDPDALHLRFPTRGGKYVSSMATEVLRQSGTDGKMMRFTGNLSLPITGRTHGFDCWITLYNSVSTTMRRNSKEKERCTYFIYAVLTKTDRHHLYRKDQGTGKRKRN